MNERMIEYLFTAQMLSELSYQLNSLKQKMKSNPTDIMMNVTKRKLINDMKILGGIQMIIGVPLMHEIENKYEVKFQFLTGNTESEVQKSDGAGNNEANPKEGKEISLNGAKVTDN